MVSQYKNQEPRILTGSRTSPGTFPDRDSVEETNTETVDHHLGPMALADLAQCRAAHRDRQRLGGCHAG